jgi:hypothetical protein
VIRGIGRVENNRSLDTKSPNVAHAASVHLRHNVIGDAPTNNTINPSLKDRWRSAPPNRMDDDQSVGLGQFAAVLLNESIFGNASFDFITLSDWVELLLWRS